MEKSCLKSVFLFVFIFCVSMSSSVIALPSYHVLPVNLALEAATEAVNACQKQGYGVTATVLTKEGLTQVVIRGDGAPPHTIENSFNKAYTIVTLGPLQKADTTSAVVKAMIPTPNPIGNWPLAPSPLPGVTFSSGAVAIKVGDEFIGGLGVSGAINGTIDEGCAQAGLAKIHNRLVP